METNNKGENKRVVIAIISIAICYILFTFLFGGVDLGIPVGMAIFMELFVSIHMSIFFYLPLSHILAPEDYKSAFLKLSIARAVILILFDILQYTAIAMIDFFAVFVGTFLVIPVTFFIIRKIDGTSLMVSNEKPTTIIPPQNSVTAKCAYCGTPIKGAEKVCSGCGAPLEGENIITTTIPTTPITPPKQVIDTNQFDPIYFQSEANLLKTVISKELEKIGVSPSQKLMPKSQLKRKKILYVFFSLLLFIYISLIFFHFPITTYLIGLVILILAFFLSNRFKLLNYLAKEIKARPSEKFSNVLMSIQGTLVPDTSKRILIPGIIGAIVIPLFLFQNPRVFFEKNEDGYAVRFYTFGLTNVKTATIPETYKGKPVTSLRGNTFSNMPFLMEVTLPDTIREIRGQAFKNDIRLQKIILPSKLEYLGGGAFSGCVSLVSIDIPDTVTFIGGEAFKNNTSLSSVKLPPNITEIRGNTFENCTSLDTINIPNRVTRIGGHAFYGCSALQFVIIPSDSALEEIGSSAFRMCPKLHSIILPENTYVNERAFKESPTTIYRYDSYLDNQEEL